MALIKDRILENGVLTKYHRIVSLNSITNDQIIIEVASYTSEEKRQEEIEAMSQEEPMMDVYIDTTYISKEYDEETTIQSAYQYLKTLDEFKGSING